MGFEPTVCLNTIVFKTNALNHSTTYPISLSKEGTRTLSFNLGKVTLYQLSYILATGLFCLFNKLTELLLNHINEPLTFDFLNLVLIIKAFKTSPFLTLEVFLIYFLILKQKLQLYLLFLQFFFKSTKYFYTFY